MAILDPPTYKEPEFFVESVTKDVPVAELPEEYIIFYLGKVM